MDDTIKISFVCDKKELVRNTFLRKFRVVPGMPELYRVRNNPFVGDRLDGHSLLY